MSNTSATGGYLAPSSIAPLYDDALTDALHAMVVGITGLPGQLVRPRWQPVPPKMPEPSVDWCAIGVLNFVQDVYGAQVHSSDGEGSTTLYRTEIIEVLASFYGPNRTGNAMLMSDGMQINQNWEAIAPVGVAFVEGGAPRQAADLLNNQWVVRSDLLITFRRMVSRTYPILNVLSAQGSIQTDRPSSQNFEITEN